MKRNLISARSVVYFIIIQALFLVICCKGRSGSVNFVTTDIIPAEEAEEQIQQIKELITDVACGCHTTLILRGEGTVWAWGRNSFGTLGNGNETDSRAPVLVAGLNDVVAISSACEFSIALRSDGKLFIWGDNSKGQLGNSSEEETFLPAEVPGLNDIEAVSLGGEHVLALGSDGTLWLWGDDYYGQLGDGSAGQRLSGY